MTTPSSERRMAENEVIFRQYNEKIKEGFDELKRLAEESHQEELGDHTDDPIHFYCECSDENCRMRILMKPSRYSEIHERRDRFVIVPGHDVANIERLINEDTEYCIVEKYLTPPPHVDALHETDIDNT